MDSLERENKEFFDRFAAYYDRSALKKWLISLQKKSLWEINFGKNSRILEVGCGTGDLLLFLSKQKKSFKLYGVDISGEMLKIARRRLLNTRVRLKLEPAERIRFRKGYFDYVLSIDAFHHYYNYESVMKNFCRVLRKNGRLVVIDVDFGFILNKIFHAIEPGNNKMFNAGEFRRLFEQYNLKGIKQKRIGLFSLLTTGEKN